MGAAEFADQLRRYRRTRCLTQEELAARAGVSPAVISRLERGLTRAPQKFTLKSLSTALELAPNEEEAFARAARRPIPSDREPFDDDEGPALEAFKVADLPVPLTPLIGREADVGTLVKLLAQSATRLLTLTGPAGVGKTRLALDVAAMLRQQAAQQVVFVGLIPVQEPQRVLAAIAQTVGIPETGAMPPRESLIFALRDRRVILVLDNFEHVLSAARGVLEVLVVCPGVQALVTSRAALNVRGERCYAVAPLALPDQTQMEALDELCRVPTVALFLERVTATQPGFALETLDAGRRVADICERLDGLPLAIELAAARVKHLGLRELHERVAQPAFLGTLGEGPQDLADHQRTMRSTIAWSYNLLSEQERRLFRWLGMFVAGASLNALVAVLRTSEEEVLTSLFALVEANLVQCVEHAGTGRYTQLMTVRAYAGEQLRAEGEWDEVQRRFAEYCAALVDMLTPTSGKSHDVVMPLVEADYDNIRAALTWADETGATALGLRMVGALRRFWPSHSQYLEGLGWLERFIARAEPPRTNDDRAALAEAWTGALVLRHRLDQFERACEAGEAALALWREIGDASLIAGGMQNLANPLKELHDFDRAAALYEESLALYRQMNNRQGMVFPLMNLGELYAGIGQPQRALELYEQSLRLSHELGESEWARGLTWNNAGEAHIALDNPRRAVDVTEPSYRMFARRHDVFGTATCAFTLGRAYWRLGEAGTARTYLDEAKRHYRTLGNPIMAARVLYVSASVALENGDVPSARRDLAQALTDATGQARESDYFWWVVERAGTCARRAGDPQTAARLFGAAIPRRDATSDPYEPAEREMRARDLDALRVALGESPLATCLAEGREMDRAAVAPLVRGVLAEAGTRTATPS
jgi:predicted ATPase/transcriptional regulator with XRE-family HTH domain